MEKEPRTGFMGEWDRLSSNMKIVAVILLIIPIFLYPPSVFLYMGYAVYLNVRDKRKKQKWRRKTHQERPTFPR